MYAFVPTKVQDDWREPDLPEDTSYWVYFYLNKSLWALVDFDSDTIAENVIPVSERLQYLLISAKEYPPALALALRPYSYSREQQAQLDVECASQREAFEDELSDRIQTHCKNQRKARFLFAEALIGDFIDFQKGKFYWLVARSEQDVVWLDGLDLARSSRTSFDINSEDFLSLSEFSEMEILSLVTE